MSKRVLRTLKINEISGVDDPAQEPALVTLLKRANRGVEFEADDDDDDDPTPASKRTDQPDPLVAVVVALMQEQNELLGKLKVKKGKTTMTKTATKRPEDFTAKVAEIRKRDNCDGMEAMQKAREEDPVAFAMYQHGPKFPDTSALAKRQAQAKTVEKGRSFMTLANAIAKRDECSGMEAMQKAREEHPDAFEAWQNG